MRDEKAPDNVPRATGPPARQPSFDQVFVAQFCHGLRPCLAALALAPSPWPGYNILKFLYFSADGNFRPGSVELLDRCRVCGVRRWSDLDAPRGTRDMAGSNRSQDILPHTASGTPAAAGGARSIVAGRTPPRSRRTGHAADSNLKFPATTDSTLRVQRSQQRHDMAVTAPLRP